MLRLVTAAALLAAAPAVAPLDAVLGAQTRPGTQARPASREIRDTPPQSVLNDRERAVAVISRAKLDAELAAMNTKTGGYFGSGLATGILLPFVGPAATWGVASGSGVQMPPEKRLEIQGQPLEYQQYFEKTFTDEVRNKRKSAALKGGLIGTGVVLLLFATAGGG